MTNVGGGDVRQVNDVQTQFLSSCVVKSEEGVDSKPRIDFFFSILYLIPPCESVANPKSKKGSEHFEQLTMVDIVQGRRSMPGCEVLLSHGDRQEYTIWHFTFHPSFVLITGKRKRVFVMFP